MKKNLKSYKIPKYTFGTQEIMGLAPLATSLIANNVDKNAEVASDGGNMLKYGSQGAQFGAQMGTSIAPGLGTAIGAGVGAIGGATYGLVDANKQQKAFKAANKLKSRKQLMADTYGAENPDLYQTDVYAHGGTVNNNIIEVETGEIVADGENVTHIGKNPHTMGGDKLSVYNKGFKRDKKQPYAIAEGTVYSTQYNEGERKEIGKNMNKVKYPMSKGSKKRAEGVLEHMQALEGTPDNYMVNGGNIPTNNYKGGLDRKLGAKYEFGTDKIDPEKGLFYDPLTGPVATEKEISTSTIVDPAKTFSGVMRANMNAFPNIYKNKIDSNSINNSPQNMNMDQINAVANAPLTGFGNQPLTSSTKDINVNNDTNSFNSPLSAYTAPLYNMITGASKPEYVTKGSYTPSKLINPEKALLPNRLKAARESYSNFKNSIVGNMTAGQRAGILSTASNESNRATQGIYDKYAASEMDIMNKNNVLLNDSMKYNNEVDYLNSENKLKAKAAGRNLVSTGLTQLSDISQLDTKNANNQEVDELKAILYSSTIPEVEKSKMAQLVLAKIKNRTNKSK